MGYLPAPRSRALPSSLKADLEQVVLLAPARVRWEHAAPERTCWFEVASRPTPQGCTFRLEFWVPEGFRERTVAALLPARLDLARFDPEECAAVDWPPFPPDRSDRELSRVARTCARLINELWGPTESDDLETTLCGEEPAGS